MANKARFESARMTIFAELETLTTEQVLEIYERVRDYAEERLCESPAERRKRKK